MSWWQDQLQEYLQPSATAVRPRGSSSRQASVLVLFTEHDHNPEIIFTLRAAHLSNHPGEVAFPGGMWEPGDETLLDTGLRESYEEIGLPPSVVKLLGSCQPRSTIAGIQVTPFVGMIPADVELTPNPAELDAIFRVPLAAFRAGIQTRTDFFTHGGRSYHVPAYHHQGYEIWGFTAAVTSELLLVLDETCDEPSLTQ